MGESEQLTQREELKNWLGRLSYILRRKRRATREPQSYPRAVSLRRLLAGLEATPIFRQYGPLCFVGICGIPCGSFSLRLPKGSLWQLCT